MLQKAGYYFPLLMMMAKPAAATWLSMQVLLQPMD